MNELVTDININKSQNHNIGQKTQTGTTCTTCQDWGERRDVRLRSPSFQWCCVPTALWRRVPRTSHPLSRGSLHPTTGNVRPHGLATTPAWAILRGSLPHLWGSFWVPQRPSSWPHCSPTSPSALSCFLLFTTISPKIFQQPPPSQSS